jgi:hypothetical protein
MPLAQRVQAFDGGVYLRYSPSVDAFGRLRVSNPQTLFESQAQYGDSSLFWETAVSGGGTVTNALASSSVLISPGGTTSGHYAYRQTRTHFRYHPGKSHVVVCTFVFDNGAVTNNRRRIGYFNANDGIFLQLLGSTLSLVRRTSTSGAPVDEVVPQASWNVDRMDGYGPSGIALDITKTQILIIDLQWLGAGQVRCYFDVGGEMVEVHRFRHANVLTLPYMATANLTIRAESENVGVAGGTGVLRQICSTVFSEGGKDEELGRQFSVNRGATSLAVIARRPVLSIRAKAAGPNAVVNTGQILPRQVDVMCDTNGALYEIVYNGTLGGGTSWGAVDASHSIAEYDTASTTIVGGIVIASGMVPSGGGGPFSAAGADSTNFFRQLPLVRTGLGGVQDVLSVVLTAVTGTSDAHAAMTWQELL